jgi:hypothetical protein
VNTRVVVAYFSGGQQIQLRTEGRDNGNLGAVAPYSVVPLNLQMSETRILIKLLQMYFPRNWEFGSDLPNFGISEGNGGVLNPQNPPLGTPLTCPGVFYAGETTCQFGRTVLTTIMASSSVQLPCRSKKTAVSFTCTTHFTL